MKTRTIRALAGEFWAEVQVRLPDLPAHWEAINASLDILMGVLARHEGHTIVNDKDLPVEPLK